MNVFLTGSTGFLAGELAVLLSKRPQIRRLYCLIRANDAQKAWSRLQQVFQFHGDAFDCTRIVPLVGDLADGSLAEKLYRLKDLREVDTVIHAAADTSFAPSSTERVESINIGGTQQILTWAQSLPNLETFLYVGTASICGTSLTHCNVLEDQSPSTSAAHLVRYCYTKMIGETNVTHAIPREKLLVVRPSIIMGDTRDWTPRSYVILWALAAVSAIRLIPSNPQTHLDIIPVDYTADAIVELLFAKRKWTTYHISAGKQSSSTLDAILHAADNSSDGRPPFKFVRHEMLQQMKKWPKKLLPQSGLQQSEYSEYLSYWNTAFNGNGNLRMLLTAMGPYFRFMDLDQTFDNSRLLADTSIGTPPPAHEYVRKTTRHLNKIDLTEGALDP
jgi:thioester reductase-like protein